jgi:hypothetical protein
MVILDKLIAEDKTTAIRLASRIQGLNNTLTNQKGVLEGMEKGGALAQKRSHGKSRP